MNADGELIIEGSCHVDEGAGTATLEPEREPGDLLKERGSLSLELETGQLLLVSDKPLVFRLWPPTNGHGSATRRTIYRLRIVAAAGDLDGEAEPSVEAESRPRRTAAP